MRYEKLNKLLKVHDLYLGDMKCERKNGKWEYSCEIYAEKVSLDFKYFCEEWKTERSDSLSEYGDNPNKVINGLFDKMVNNTIQCKTWRPVKKTNELKWNGEAFVLYNQEGQITTMNIPRNKFFQTMLENTTISDSMVYSTGRVYKYENKTILEYTTSSKNVWIDEEFYNTIPKDLLEEFENEVKIYLYNVKGIHSLDITHDSHKYSDMIN
tara:strand:+ start:1144 stop:1776 length:633 start_codon:yes stop_codon:yes gene_type:complete